MLASFCHVLQIPEGGKLSPNELIINSSSKIKAASLALGSVAREVVGAKIVYR
jgi:hypothetical protein